MVPLNIQGFRTFMVSLTYPYWTKSIIKTQKIYHNNTMLEIYILITLNATYIYRSYKSGI